MQVINKKIIVIFICLSIFIFGLFKLFNKEKIELDSVILDTQKQDNTFAIYVEQNDGNYEESDNNVFPLEEYVFNKTLSGCLDNNSNEVEDVLIYNYVSKELNLRVNKPVTCYVYFDKQEVKEFSYTGSYEEFIVPKSGEYQIELWGASGGDKFEGDGIANEVKEETAGRGAYTKGVLKLNKNDKLYFFIGENPTKYGAHAAKEIFNGGGYGEAPGGGATDVRLNIPSTGNWNDFDSLKSRIMVAAGGGGGTYSQNIDYTKPYRRGDGGTLIGIDAQFFALYGNGEYSYEFSGHGGTQTSGGQPGIKFSSIESKYTVEMTGKFGIGGYGIPNGSYASSGGGGGYYGGGHGNHSGASWTGGGGGSSFISGYEGCIAINENSTEGNITPKSGCNNETQDIICSYHYSGKVFTNPVMFAGNEEMPTYDGEGTMTGNTGNGHAKVKLIVGG